MATIHELYGIQSEQLEQLRIEYGNLLSLLLRVKVGEVDICYVTISGNSWTYNPPSEIEANPAAVDQDTKDKELS